MGGGCGWPVVDFLRSERAGTTAIAGIFVTLVAVLTLGVVVDAQWLGFNHARAAHAAQSGAVAAAIELRTLSSTDTDAEVVERLEAAAYRLAWLNLAWDLSADPFDEDDLLITVVADRDAGRVDLEATVRLSGLLFAPFYALFPGTADLASADRVVTVTAAAERARLPISVVLALDSSASMRAGLDGRPDPGSVGASTRFASTQVAAGVLIDALVPNPADPVRVAFIPWGAAACVDAAVCAVTVSPYHFYSPPADEIVGFSGDAGAVRASLAGLRLWSYATYSASALDAAAVLLAGEDASSKRVVVLLTDGEDTLASSGDNCPPRQYGPIPAKWRSRKVVFNGVEVNEWYWDDRPGQKDYYYDFSVPACSEPRAAACSAVRAAGYELYVVAALAPALLTPLLESQLLSCVGGDSTKLFVDVGDSAALTSAFVEIADQLLPVRRVF